METGNWYQISQTDKIDTPALVIYRQRVVENIRLLKSMIDDPLRLRPHVKTHKTKEAALLMMEAGIRKFKCATIAEAEMLGMCKAEDVLLAYQPGGPKLLRFTKLVKQYPATAFSCLVDNRETALLLSGAALRNEMTIAVYIDLNTGMNRTGIRPGEEALELYAYCSGLEGLSVMGFHLYDGHIRNKDIRERTSACQAAFGPVQEMMRLLMEKGYGQPTIVAGGTPTFPVYAGYKNIECSPGTFIYWDKGYLDSYAEQHFLPAALVITRVVSLPDDSKICLDMGYKAIAAENELSNRVFFLNAPDLRVVSQSEEHLVMEAGKGHSWKIGDLLYGLPVHICPTCATYDIATVIEDGAIAATWEIIARNRQITI